MRRASVRKRATILSAAPIADCQHESLRIPKIRIAEKCPRCRLWIISTGAAFAVAREAVERARAIDEGRSFIRLAQAIERLEGGVAPSAAIRKMRTAIRREAAAAERRKLRLVQTAEAKA